MVSKVVFQICCFLCFASGSYGQSINVINGRPSQPIKKGCEYVISTEIEGAQSVDWLDVFYNPLDVPGPNYIDPYVSPDKARASLTVEFATISQDVLLLATNGENIEKKTFFLSVDQNSGPLDVSMHNVDIQQTELGDMVNLTCTVTTCRTMEYSVEILGPSNQTLRRWDGMFDQGPNVFTWNMRVSMENIGQYRCLARAMMNGLTFEEVSMADVSGSPRIPTTKTAPTVTTTPNTSVPSVIPPDGSSARTIFQCFNLVLTIMMLLSCCLLNF
jgi:hypothetical protein